MLKEKRELSTQNSISFSNEGEIKTFSGEGELRGYGTNRSSLWETLKVLEAEVLKEKHDKRWKLRSTNKNEKH